MKSPLELFRRLERAVRTPRERLPIDAFLPPPEELPTEFADPPPPQLGHVREMGATPEEERAARERRRRRRVKKPATTETAPRSLEDEIHDFINRDKPEGLSEDDLSDFQGGFDPTQIPEK